MQIIQPAHNKKVVKVKSWRSIKKDAEEMANMIKTGFKGYWKEAQALSHAQVSNDPQDFFVLNEKWRKTFFSCYVINPRILKKDFEIEHKEACMSFPFRKEVFVRRSRYVWLFYWIPCCGFCVPIIKKFKDMPAYIIQHERGHSNGKNIYNLK